MAAPKPHRAAMFAPFADSLSHHGLSFPLNLDAVWLSRPLTLLQTFALPFAFYFKPVMVLVAMSWLIYRAYQVLGKPLEDLATLLGFEIPSPPLIDLATVKADGAIVHWTLPEKPLKHKAIHKFDIYLNGSLIDTLPIHESAATITGLQPGCFYVLRVSLVNSMEFSSKSPPIRFRTKQLASGDFFTVAPDAHDPENDTVQESIPRVRPHRALKDIAPASPDSIAMTRENSTGRGPSKSLTSRRPSPSATEVEKHGRSGEHNEPVEGGETITQLTARLDAVRRETDEVERQAREEEEEDLRQKDELSKERDELKAEAMEKDKASRNLKKEVTTLERQNTQAQNDRTKAERVLAQKKQDRQKLKEDMVRWEQEAVKFKADVERIKREKEEYLCSAEREKEELRNKQAEETSAIKVLDDEVREKSAEIKKLERAMKNGSPNSADGEPNLVQQLQQDAEDRRQWEITYQAMQQQYAITSQKLEQAKRFQAEQQAYLDQLRARRRQEETVHYASPPSTQERPLRRGDSQRSRRAQSYHSASDSPRPQTFPITSGAFASSGASISSPFVGAPFLNIHNGMTVGPTAEMIMSDEDRDKMTGGALMSPGAGADLLPADLFGEGDNKTPSELILPGLGSLPGLPGLPGPMQQMATYDTGPGSPASESSRLPSATASPRASLQNIVASPEATLMDADRKSVRSTRSNRATSGGGTGSRFSGMFGIKQRVKTAPAAEGPALSKASSMPRQDGGIAGIDSETRKRNSSISDAFMSGSIPSGDGFEPPPLSNRRSRFGIFGKSSDGGGGWPSTFNGLGNRPASPRPGSTHSSELPRPSMDGSRWGMDGWGSGDATGGARSSPLAFGSGWHAPQQSRIFGSRHPSRRPSAQYGGSGPPDDIMEDEDSDAQDSYRAANLGPIGSRPLPGGIGAEQAPSQDVPKLNPAAKDFKSFFSSMKLTKSKDSSSNAGSASNTPNMAQHDDDDLSPPNSRRSRDARSITTAESSLAESIRNSTDLARTSSYTYSDAAPSPYLGSSSAGKESFMQKLTRKSSSSKFTLPAFKREKHKMDPGTPTAIPTEEEEEGGSLSASASSAGREIKDQGRGSGRNWGNVLKLGSKKEKKGNETPSISGFSMTTSGTEDNDDHE